MRQVLVTLSLMIVALSGYGQETKQDIEYGQKSEMRGAKVVYVLTGTNLEFREHVIKLLREELPEVKISDKRDMSVDLILQFEIESRGDRKGSATLEVHGRPSSDSCNCYRILAMYEDSKSSIWTSKLSTVLTRRFIRDYKEVNRSQ